VAVVAAPFTPTVWSATPLLKFRLSGCGVDLDEKKGIKKLFYFDQNNVNFNIFWYEKKVASRNRF